MKTLWLIDFDGTLADTEPMGIRNLAELAAGYAGTDLSAMQVFLHQQQGRVMAQYHAALCAEFGLDPEVITLDRLRHEHRRSLAARFRAGVAAAPAMIATLQRLRDRGDRLRICTNSDAERVEAAIDGLDGGRALRRLVHGAHYATRWKPDPQVYFEGQQIERALVGGDPGRIVIVEDSLTGLASACAFRTAVQNRVPTRVIGYAGLHATPEAQRDLLADHGADAAVTGGWDGILAAAEAA